ncbi:MAG: T9SS type A sorting domain-containing protein [Candidatus Cyclobacteriaceae bacterium M3_2C_046]
MCPNIYGRIQKQFAGKTREGESPALFEMDERYGKLTWNTPGKPGDYYFAYQVCEWRKVKEEYVKIASLTRDIQVAVFDTPNRLPEVIAPADTFVLAGDNLTMDWELKDPDQDPVKIEFFGLPFLQDSNLPVIHLKILQAYHQMATISWNTDLHSRSDRPMEIFYRASDDNPQYDQPDLAVVGVVQVWITDDLLEIPSPSNLSVEEIIPGQFTLKWRDNSDNEEFFQLEVKAGTHFKPFRQIEQNESSLTLKNLICDSTYYFRIKATSYPFSSAYSGPIRVDSKGARPYIIQKDDTLWSSQGSRYQWYFDDQPMEHYQQKLTIEGFGMYQVEVKDALGCWEKSLPFMVTEAPGWLVKAPIKIYPNPARDLLYIELAQGGHFPKSLQLINLQGKVMGHWQFRGNRYQLNLAQLKAGVYLIRLELPEQIFEKRITIIQP